MSILKEHDRMALITFDDTADELITLKKINNENSKMFKEFIEGLSARGSTTINSGVSLAIELLKERKTKNEVTSIFLLSDGVDNIGEKALAVIKNTIIKCKINENFTINSFGFGHNHDAHLMREIAKCQGGNFYFIDNLDSIDECFVDAIGMLFSVALKDIEMKVQVNNSDCFSDMRIKKTYGDMWSYHNNEHKIKLKVFTMGMKKDFICEINVPPCKKKLLNQMKNRMVLKVGLKGKTIKDQPIAKTSELYLHFFNPLEKNNCVLPLNIDVIVNHFRVKGAEKIENAKNFADNGQYLEAEQELEEIRKELDECGCKDHPVLIILKAEIENSQKLCTKINYRNAGTSSYLTACSNNIMYQQSCPMLREGNVQNLYATPIQTQMNINLMNVKKSNNFN